MKPNFDRVRDMMGYAATDEDVAAMIEILEELGQTDIETIPEAAWLGMLDRIGERLTQESQSLLETLSNFESRVEALKKSAKEMME